MKKQTPKQKTPIKETEELKNQLLRALADYDNLRKRVEKQQEELTKVANIKLIVKLLAVLDMIKEVQKHIEESGLAISIGEFEKVLESEGIVPLRVKPGDDFDESLHDAVGVVESNKTSGKPKIKKVVLEGWAYDGDLIIRPAKVEVEK